VGGVLKLSSPATREYWEIAVLHEDEDLLAIAKPSRLLSSPDRYDPERPNLMRLIHEGIAKGVPWASERGLTYLANVHRLDFETTGVMLLAKNKPALVQLASQFGSGKPHKQYVALARGGPKADAFEVNAKIGPDPLRTGFMRVDQSRGKKSITRFTVAERYRGYTLLRCNPVTGRTHQIRVHLRWRRLPLVGDGLYGGQPLWLSRIKPGYRPRRDGVERPLMERVALHAESLAFAHPISGNEVKIVCPWPKDLAVAIKYLRRYALERPLAAGPGFQPGAPFQPSVVREELDDAVGDQDGAGEQAAPGEM
jgi:RluA family pseudouridine synthase